jgi:hypothetical protein
MNNGLGTDYSMVYQGPLTYAVVYNLTSGYSYTFMVSAVNYNGEGPTSVTNTFTSCVAPSGVSAPTLIDSTATTVTLRWT